MPRKPRRLLVVAVMFGTMLLAQAAATAIHYMDGQVRSVNLRFNRHYWRVYVVCGIASVIDRLSRSPPAPSP